jgi:hypothetical protein
MPDSRATRTSAVPVGEPGVDRVFRLGTDVGLLVGGPIPTVFRPLVKGR